jgi:nucleoside-diphosphate-sugar epimerase
MAVSKPETNHGIYNIGSNDNLSLIEAARMVADKYDVSVESVEWPKQAEKIESGDTIFDDSRLLESTNYEYQYSLYDWISELE